MQPRSPLGAGAHPSSAEAGFLCAAVFRQHTARADDIRNKHNATVTLRAQAFHGAKFLALPIAPTSPVPAVPSVWEKDRKAGRALKRLKARADVTGTAFFPMWLGANHCQLETMVLASFAKGMSRGIEWPTLQSQVGNTMFITSTVHIV